MSVIIKKKITYSIFILLLSFVFQPNSFANRTPKSPTKKLQKELDYAKGFLKSIEGKLNNERFINNAPEQVVANERKKLSDTKEKIKILEDKIKSLKP